MIPNEGSSTFALLRRLATLILTLGGATLAPAGTVSGTVAGEDGQAIAGAIVTLSDARGVSESIRQGGAAVLARRRASVRRSLRPRRGGAAARRSARPVARPAAAGVAVPSARSGAGWRWWPGCASCSCGPHAVGEAGAVARRGEPPHGGTRGPQAGGGQAVRPDDAVTRGDVRGVVVHLRSNGTGGGAMGRIVAMLRSYVN